MNFGAPCRAYAAIARGRAEELPLIPAQAGIQATAGPRFRGDERDDSFEDARLPAGALRARGAECGICRKPIGQADRDLGPADAPGRAGAIPPNPAPAVIKAYQREIGARRRNGKT